MNGLELLDRLRGSREPIAVIMMRRPEPGTAGCGAGGSNAPPEAFRVGCVDGLCHQGSGVGADLKPGDGPFGSLCAPAADFSHAWSVGGFLRRGSPWPPIVTITGTWSEALSQPRQSRRNRASMRAPTSAGVTQM